jgi:acetyl-CoA acetyltransferase
MSSFTLRDATAVVGVGYAGFSKDSGVSTLTLAVRAITAALADAGIPPAALDGVATHRVGDSVPAAIVGEAMGIADCQWHLDLNGGGSVSHSVVGQAALAVSAGLASTVVCWRAINSRSENRLGASGLNAAADQPEWQYKVPYGYATPLQQFAGVSRAYLARFNQTREMLGRVAVTQRDNALLNERAMMKTPLTMEEYLTARWIAEPLGLYDCCPETDAAVALVITTIDRARDLRQVPVTISGAAWGGGATLFRGGRDGLLFTATAQVARRLYRSAGVGPGEIDVACLYDAFTTMVPLLLEDYGFCLRGEAGPFILAGGTALDGPLPVNPHGGHLSEGYVHGLNHIAEAVQQLRGAAARRQVKGAEVALCSGPPGMIAGASSGLVLRKAG